MHGNLTMPGEADGAAPLAGGALPESARDAERFGAPPEVVAAVAHRTGGGFDGVWPENLQTVCAFLACSTQWRTAPVGAHGCVRMHWIGLDYTAAKVAIEALGIAVTPELWTGLQIMEAAARNALNGVEE